MRLLAALATLAAGLVLAGCAGEAESDEMESADLANGKALFVNGKDGKQPCGSCHTLADAGTQGQVGPNLDHAFGYSREQGFDESSFFDVTLDMIDLAAPPMPTDLVTGQDAIDVAAYVAAVAGTEIAGEETPQVAVQTETGAGGGETGGTETGGAETGGTETGGAETGGAETGAGGEAAGGGESTAAGKEVFMSAGCVACHTLSDAGATGTVGPNLDESTITLEDAIATITNGRGGVMPAFKDQLTEEQIAEVAQYVVAARGG
jgi:mono/diheme cytochrome c family protein